VVSGALEPADVKLERPRRLAPALQELRQHGRRQVEVRALVGLGLGVDKGGSERRAKGACSLGCW
jgi:hypothetical protein